MLANVKYTRRSFLRLSALAALGLVAAACGATPTPTKAPATKAAVEPTKAVAATAAPTKAAEVTKAPAAAGPITMRFVNRDLPFGAHMIEFSRRYEKANPNITVKNEDVSWNDIPKKTELMMVGGALPDVIWQQGAVMPYYAYKGAYAPLDDIVKADGFDLKVFFPWLLKGHCVYGGKTYALPGEPNPGQGSCMYINTDMYTAKGLTVPETDAKWTYEQFREICLKLTDSSKKVFAYNEGWSPQSMACFAGSWGGLLTSGGEHRGLGEKFTFTTDPKMVEGFKFYLNLRIKDHVMPLATELMEGGTMKMWLSQVLVIRTGNMGDLQGIDKTIAGAYKWKPVMSPLGVAGGMRGSGNNTVQWQMGMSTKYPEQAWGLLKLLTSVECSTWNTLNTGKQPGGRIASWQDPEITKLPITGEMFKVYGDWMAKGTVEMQAGPANLRINEFNDMWTQDGQPLHEGLKSWDEQAPIIQKKGEEIFAKPKP